MIAAGNPLPRYHRVSPLKKELTFQYFELLLPCLSVCLRFLFLEISTWAVWLVCTIIKKTCKRTKNEWCEAKNR
ncbi:hypothetical protein Avbf_11591 [Armadillidium vulgare]|nr:hypothetical protein Avbf_11591 [Armadillidium vulgare]